MQQLSKEQFHILRDKIKDVASAASEMDGIEAQCIESIMYAVLGAMSESMMSLIDINRVTIDFSEAAVSRIKTSMQ